MKAVGYIRVSTEDQPMIERMLDFGNNCFHFQSNFRGFQHGVPAIELLNSIRGLRDFVRAENLQTGIKQLTGKSVSSLKKDELREAVELAIAQTTGA